MTNFELISSIMRGVWAIDEEAAQSYLPVLASVLKYKAEFEKNQAKDFHILSPVSSDAQTARYSRWDGFNDAPKNSVAVIPLQGALMKHDKECGPIGTASIGKIIRQADDHHNIAAIVLHIDTPGGTVDGTETLANIIKNTQKPVVAFVDGMMASAGVWIGSHANEVIASNDMDRIGSVGVMMSFMDIQPALEEMGVKFHTLVSDLSKDKNRVMEDVRKGEYKEYIETILNPLAERFRNVVKENFPNVDDTHLTGSMFFAKDLLGVMVDSIGTLDDAVDRAIELANENSNTLFSNNKTQTSMNQFTHVNSALGVNLESSDGYFSLNEDQMSALDDALSNQAQVQSDLQTAQQAQSAAESAQQAAEAERDQLQERLNELEGSSASERSAAVVETDKKATEKGSVLTSAQELYGLISDID